MSLSLGYSLEHTDTQSAARTGTFQTERSQILTPAFMPVGTGGTVKGITPADLMHRLDLPIFLCNTYHLLLRPGPRVLRQAGGLHRFIGWNRSLLTDSGGYQIYSLRASRQMDEDGVCFKSHMDGSYHYLTPEKAMQMQKIIGADICMAFDECTPYPASYAITKRSMERTHRWLERSYAAFEATSDHYGKRSYLFPIVQGGMYADLRLLSASCVQSYASEGYAIGGLSVGESDKERFAMLQVCTEALPQDKARYLMGVGTPSNLLDAIAMGVDMFDCVIPTRHARHGLLYTTEGRLHIRNRKWQNDFSPIDPLVTLSDQVVSKAYLRHLFVSHELLAAMLASLHNLSFYAYLMQQAREHIIAGDFLRWKEVFKARIERRL